MAYQVGFNVLIAIGWAALSGEWTLSGLAAGYLVGIVAIALFSSLFAAPFYMRTVWAIGKLLLLFLKELTLSTWDVMKVVLKPRLDMSPGIIAYETGLKSDWEVTLLGCLITLTPGTLTLEVSPDQRILYIHAIDAKEAEQMMIHIRDTFERAIGEVTRS